jgi:carboxyl-terminal processing protease
LDFAIVRDKIPIFSVDAGYMASPKTGYIKVNRFSATTLEEFKEQFSELEAQGMKNLILDLQGNGGGYLNTAHDLVDELLAKDKLVVYTEGKSFPRENLVTRRNGAFEKGRLVVLIDESSASASEIVAGAVQDWDRGLIVGRRSFGKGLVQRGYNLPNGAQFRLTVSRYYTPSGRSIQKPYDQGEEAYRKEKYERFSSGELFSSDSISFPDSLKYETNNKRIVYGGGGITPDFFVPLDTTQTSDFFSLLVRKGVLNQFTLDYTNDGRKKLLKKYDSVENFAKKFKTEDIIEELKEYTDNAGIKWDDEGYATSQLWIQTRVKAFIARNLWDTEAFYVIINDLNKSYQEALQLIEGKDYNEFKLTSKI